MKHFLAIILLLAATALAQEPQGKRIVKMASEAPQGCIALGNEYYDCEERAVLPEGATVLTTGHGAARYLSLPDTDKGNVLRARVYRSKDGTSLRLKANTEAGGSLGSKVPATGKTSATPAPTASADAVLAKAREFHAAGIADYLTVPMAQVRTGDVVEEDTVVPHLWMGE